MALFGNPGERISYEYYPHPTGGPQLVLIHGLTASAASFLSNLPVFREHFSVLTIELLGHGGSDAPEHPEPYSADAQVARSLALIDHLSIDRFLLCGHSLGGGVALRMALDAPERLTGLIVINSNAAAATPDRREHSRAGAKQTAARIRAEGTDFVRDSWVYPARSRRLPAEAREALARDFDRITPAGLAGTYESLVPNISAWERLPELAVPMLLVIGTRDEGFVRNSVAFIDRLPAHLLRVIELPAAGHAANLEAREDFEEAVLAFARSLGVLLA